MVFAFFNIGAQELIVLFLGFVSALLVTWPFWRIFSKAGFPGWLAIGMVIPLVHLVLLCYLAFAEWPALSRSRSRPEGRPRPEVPN